MSHVSRIIIAVLALAAGTVATAGEDAAPSPAEVDRTWADEGQRAAAAARGAAVFAANCASCHGEDLKGAPGAHAPDLTDAYWLFGGEDLETFQVRPSDVEVVVRYGIRSGHERARLASPMPGWAQIAQRSPGLADADLDDVTEYVLHLSGQPADTTAALRGKHLFNGPATCFDCHASDAKGDSSIGAPDLTRPAVWLYGSDRAAIRATIVEGRAQTMPGFDGQLSEGDIRDVSIYVHGRAAALDF